ncbi:MAG: ParA family protein [Verrucomicrobia bacterium]|nr:ParA family protein [Verrucomicrobiota bacterium]
MPTLSFAFANQKGGVGKTTTVVSLAACLADAGKRVLVIDFDPQANATSGLGQEKLEGHSVYDALLNGHPLTALIRQTEFPNLDLIPSEEDLAAAEVDVPRAERFLERFKMAVEPIKASGNYDFIFVDCPPSLGVLTMNALVGVDRICIALQCEYYALEGLTVILRVVEHLRSSGANPALDVEGIVMTMFDSRTNLANQVVDEVRKHFADKVFKTVIPRTVRLSEAPSFGKPIIHYDKHSAGATAYTALAKEFLKRQRAAEPPPAAPVAAPAPLEAAAPAAPEPAAPAAPAPPSPPTA